MKITLSNQFFEKLSHMPADECKQVVDTMAALMDKDEDAIENYDTSSTATDSPLLAEFVQTLQKRVRADRRRRERREAKSVEKQSAKRRGDGGSQVKPGQIVDMYTMAVNAVLAGGASLGHAERATVRQLTKALMKRMDAIAAAITITRRPTAQRFRSSQGRHGQLRSLSAAKGL
ncbi:MAG: hypothetical protein K2K86_04595 [Muribaculaceae bacterium]|nr:hypothetical protein [Muribaculaceae bacterium]